MCKWNYPILNKHVLYAYTVLLLPVRIASRAMGKCQFTPSTQILPS